MAKRLAELGALQDAVSNDEAAPKRLGLAGYIRGLFLDWSANPYNPLTRLSARGRLLGYFWDSGAIGLSMNFADQNYLVKDGTVKSKSFSDIVNFSRTTNATVTNSAGLIAYAPHNFLTFSEQFDNAAWVKTNNVLVTANGITAPNGTTTADKLIATTTSGQHYLTLSGGITTGINAVTFSFYAKTAEYNYVAFYVADGNVGRAFDLTNGTLLGTIGGNSPTNSTINSVGSGWYRCTITWTPSSGSPNPRIYNTTDGSTTTFTGDNTSGVYIWGAQLEIGSTATTYNPTTVKNLLGFSELFDNAAWAKSNSFVQTNLLTYSEAFDSSDWNKLIAGTAGSTIIANQIIAPNKYQTADKIYPNANGIAQTNQTKTVITSSVVTVSCYFKAGEIGFGYIQINGTTGGTTVASFVSLNLNTGEIGAITSLAGGGIISPTATVTNVGSGWYRLILTGGIGTSNTIAVIGFGISGSITSRDVTASGTSGIYIWGAQLVQGSVAGDYRRTDAAALPVYYPNHNGVVCAEKLVATTTNGQHSLTISGVIAGKITQSVYAKAGEYNWIILQNPAGFAYFNVLTGTVGTQTGVVGAIETTGNGYYRCSILGTAATSGNAVVWVTNANGITSFAGDGSSGVYIFGAQLSDSASLDPYVLNAAAAPTAAAYYGARFDYDPVTLAPDGLLIEEQRSNLLLQSETFNNASWVTSNATVNANNITSPDGTVDADKLIENTANAYHGAYQSVTTSGVITFSAYFKPAERTHALMFFDSVGAGSCIFNLSNNTFSLTTGTRVASALMVAIGNGWYRCSVTTPSLASAAYFPAVAVSNGTAEYTGNGTSGVYVWGAQLEVGAFATSYIPTVASQVTRAADIATIQGSNFYSWYNQNEGSFSLISSSLSIASSKSQNLISVFLSGTELQRLWQWSGAPSTMRYTVIANGVNSVELPVTISANTMNKYAFGYARNNFAYSVNSNTIQTDTSSETTSNLVVFGIGSVNNGEFLCGHIKQISYYPQRLSNDVLKGLTA